MPMTRVERSFRSGASTLLPLTAAHRMILRSTLLRSRFGRRLLALFVGCALVPIALLAFLSFRHMTRQLKVQSQQRLLQINKALGHAMFERLLLLEATLKSIPARAITEVAAAGQSHVEKPKPAKRSRSHSHVDSTSRSRAPAGNRTQGLRWDGRIALGGVVMDRGQQVAAPAPALAEAEATRDTIASRTLIAGLDLLARRRFSALEFVSDAGKGTAVFGQPRATPEMTATQLAAVRRGNTLVLRQRLEKGDPLIYMVRRLERPDAQRGMLVGEISAEYLWGTRDQTMPSPTAQMAVLDSEGNVLTGSAPFAAVPADQALDVKRPAGFGAFESILHGEPHISSYWPITLGEAFDAPNWTLVLSESKQTVFRPMTDFANTFIAIVVACTLAVLLLSVIQIRRGLLPLGELQKGTRRIALRDFDSRVAVTSRDEFAELADSFNAMATWLGKQFKALATAADIDRAVLSSTDASTIVDAVLARICDIYPCGSASVILVPPDRTAPVTSWIQSYGDGRTRQAVRVELNAADVRDLAGGPEVREVHSHGPLPGYLQPMAALGVGSFVVLPLSYQQQLSGILVLGVAAETPGTTDDLLQARRLADQVAVALSNARMIDQVRDLAYYDSLTGLLNRASLKDRLAHAIVDAKRTHRLAAAFFIDLDNFGRINDTLGHDLGDELLRQVAARLRSCCIEDSSPIARLGGDEFTVVLAGISEADQSVALARRILSTFAPPFQLGTHEVFVSASIGIAACPEDGEDVETLLTHADAAMYAAKNQGGNGYQLFSRSMTVTALHRLTLENDLRRALERDELVLHYQPIVDATSGAIVGAEALVRWQHPALGLLLPSEFVPIAEENGLIVPVGEWVLRTACAQNRQWQSDGLPPIRTVVNLSGRQLRQSTLIETVRDILRQTGLDPRWLGLELTESMLMDRQHEAIAALQALRAMGLHLSIDDFGTGYSSLSYLKHFPVDTLKIDRCFVRELTSAPGDAAITAAIIAMAHALELKVVAEGVETEEQLAFLRSEGCDEIQGYLMGRPVVAERFAEWLGRGRPASRVAARRPLQVERRG